MTRRATLAAGLALALLFAGGYAAAAHRSASHDRLLIEGIPPPVPAFSSPPVTSPAEPSPSPPPQAQPTAPGRTVGPLRTKRLTGAKAVALTFDDGPHATWTPKILDQLRAAQVKATFCLVGQEVRRHPALVARIVREGHSLCNHSWRHDLDLGRRSEAQIRADLSRTNREILRAAPDARITYYRQPGGKWTAELIKVVESMGMIPLHWDVDPKDWQKPKSETIRKRVDTQVRSGSIILLHDGGGDRSATVAACAKLFGSLRRTYGIVRLT